MTGGSIRIGRLAGIPIGVQHPEEVDGIAPGVSYLFGFISALLLFASILLHELGHALVARRHGVIRPGTQG